jgi:hypothetical protein
MPAYLEGGERNTYLDWFFALGSNVFIQGLVTTITPRVEKFTICSAYIDEQFLKQMINIFHILVSCILPNLLRYDESHSITVDGYLLLLPEVAANVVSQ